MGVAFTVWNCRTSKPTNMNKTPDRLTTIVKALREPIGAGCPMLHGVYSVAREYPASPAGEAVKAQVDKMLTAQRSLCADYDNLRSLTATWEREQGVEKPVFYEGEINETGCGRKCRQAEMLKRPEVKES